jgi:ubiquinone/menaquinone biosynthesis C-methylase UbiE
MTAGHPSGLDRYKASSLRAYDDRLPRRYDDAIALRVLRPTVMDDFVVEAFGSGIAELAFLDVGCATGRLLKRLAAAGARRLAGTDLAPRIVEVARERLRDAGIEAELRSGDAETRIQWPDDTFDVVTMTGVVHHFLAPGAAFKEVARVLRPTGALVIADAVFFPPIRQLFNLALKVHPHEGDCCFRTPSEVALILESQGWHVRLIRRVNWWAYGLVARRRGDWERDEGAGDSGP